MYNLCWIYKGLLQRGTKGSERMVTNEKIKFSCEYKVMHMDLNCLTNSNLTALSNVFKCFFALRKREREREREGYEPKYIISKQIRYWVEIVICKVVLFALYTTR